MVPTGERSASSPGTPCLCPRLQLQRRHILWDLRDGLWVAPGLPAFWQQRREDDSGYDRFMEKQIEKRNISYLFPYVRVWHALRGFTTSASRIEDLVYHMNNAVVRRANVRLDHLGIPM